MTDFKRAAMIAATLAAAPAAAQAPGFNPALSVIIDGAFYHDDRDEHADEADEAGDDGHDHDGGLNHGFNLREVEIVLSSTIDPYFDGVAAFAVADGAFEVEEAFVTTRALPAGFVVKAGKFLSDIGYLNAQHPHAWSFSDRPLVNEQVFGPHGLQETGIQAAWVPATPIYARFGIEALQGDNTLAPPLETSGHGPRVFTAFANVAPDLGYDHALQAGFFGGYGDLRMWGADLVYKYDAGGAAGKGSLVAQAEYVKRARDVGGYYAQAVYGFARRWNAGVRIDHVGHAERAMAMVAWMPTEFSRIRLQWSRGDDDAGEAFDQVFLQWQMSLGAHGAHAF